MIYAYEVIATPEYKTGFIGGSLNINIKVDDTEYIIKQGMPNVQ